MEGRVALLCFGFFYTHIQLQAVVNDKRGVCTRALHKINPHLRVFDCVAAYQKISVGGNGLLLHIQGGADGISVRAYGTAQCTFRRKDVYISRTVGITLTCPIVIC